MYVVRISSRKFVYNQATQNLYSFENSNFSNYCRKIRKNLFTFQLRSSMQNFLYFDYEKKCGKVGESLFTFKAELLFKNKCGKVRESLFTITFKPCDAIQNFLHFDNLKNGDFILYISLNNDYLNFRAKNKIQSSYNKKSRISISK